MSDPSHNAQSARTHLARGMALRAAGQVTEALASFAAAMAADPTNPNAVLERGTAYWMLGQPEAALRDYTHASALAPEMPEAYFNSAAALRALRRLPEAVTWLEQGLKRAPTHAGALNTRAVLLIDLGDYAGALTTLDQSLALAPGNASALSNRAAVLNLLLRHDEALANATAVLQAQPKHADAHFHHGNASKLMGRPDEARLSYERAFAIKPDTPYLHGVVLNARMQVCDWRDFDANVAALGAGVARGAPVAPPFPLLALIDDPALHRRAAEIWAADKLGAPQAPRLPVHPKQSRLRLGYFSPDFRNHPTSHLMAEVFERHDRTQFETYAFSFGPDTSDEMRVRVKRAFDHFIDVRGRSDADVTALARAHGIDVAVDLAGYISDGRPGIFAGRAAPVQISYLAYPGTLGAPHMDYVIADPVVIPAEACVHFSEKVIAIPCYQPNDSTRIVPPAPERTAAGLPEEGFVFCCLNNAYKITPHTFAGWMRILHAIEASVLWLYAQGEAQHNLRAAAREAGVAPERLIFAASVPPAAHLARYQLADLFLDTLPYNAHTTTSDALWAGLPVITCPGRSFAARVAASLLHAVDLPELIAPDQKTYEALAITLAKSPARLAALRDKLVRTRGATLLFNVKTVTRALEMAYLAADARCREGLAPADIVISP